MQSDKFHIYRQRTEHHQEDQSIKSSPIQQQEYDVIYQIERSYQPHQHQQLELPRS